MKKNQEFADRLAELLNPTRTAANDLYEQAGRAVIKISDIERVLVAICIVLSPGAEKAAVEIFLSDWQLDRRLKFVNYLVGRWKKPAVAAEWQNIQKRLREHKGIRNLVAHQGMVEGEPNKLGIPELFLHPLSLKKGGKKLSLKDIKVTADALEALLLDVQLFFINLRADAQAEQV
jgi:hypothetical protein